MDGWFRFLQLCCDPAGVAAVLPIDNRHQLEPCYLIFLVLPWLPWLRKSSAVIRAW